MGQDEREGGLALEKNASQLDKSRSCIRNLNGAALFKQGLEVQVISQKSEVFTGRCQSKDFLSSITQQLQTCPLKYLH